MQARKRLAIITLLLTPVLSLAAAAQTPEFLGSHSDWNVYAFTEDSQKVCYMASEPKEQEGDYTRRGNPAVLVTRRPGSPAVDEVSVQPGYSYLDGSEVEVDVGGREFVLFARGEHAWTKTEEADRELITAMKRGADMTVRGTSVERTYSLDIYSLLGFTTAYEAMVNACNRGSVPKSQPNMAATGPSERETIEYIHKMGFNSAVWLGQRLHTPAFFFDDETESIRIRVEFIMRKGGYGTYGTVHNYDMPVTAIEAVSFDDNEITFWCTRTGPCINEQFYNDDGPISNTREEQATITFYHLNRDQTEKLKNAFVHLLRVRGLSVEDRGELNEELF